uniref:Ulp1 protease-like n=1 Tax=Oryza sativa subsp. japonica TaxID=39947 RepID=Q2QUZ9_ORYSJ|nr:hypothetical protein LOC_Os12g14530 [Oryza sativa Japonica Group]
MSAPGPVQDQPLAYAPSDCIYKSNKEQLSTTVGCGQVHRIVENDLDKCRVVAPNLPMKTDDLSHSIGHGWTTQEKWLSYDYYLALDQRCSDSPITSTSTKLISGTRYRQVFYPEIPYHKRHLALKPILMFLYAVLTKPLRNLRELRLGTPRADKALSDPSETKDHENSIRHCQRLHVSMVLHQDRLRQVRQMLTRLRRRLYAYSITRERLMDLDKEYGMKRWRDESAISDLAGHRFEEEDYPVIDYESDLQTAMSTTVR